jgi:uncharacterized membrane protein YgcG
MASLRRKLKNKKAPEGWTQIEDVIEDFEQQMKDAVNEEHEGKRKNEGAWKIHRLHWEKNRFIYDLMYQRKVMSKDLVRGRGRRGGGRGGGGAGGGGGARARARAQRCCCTGRRVSVGGRA